MRGASSPRSGTAIAKRQDLRARELLTAVTRLYGEGASAATNAVRCGGSYLLGCAAAPTASSSSWRSRSAERLRLTAYIAAGWMF
jgi:hypothetical protein